MIDVNSRKVMTCPLTLMSGKPEKCVNGWVKSMGEDETTGERPVCRWWSHVHAKDPFSEQIVEMWDCAVPWLVTVMADVSQRSMQVAASTQEVRNTLLDLAPAEAAKEALKKSVTRMMIQGTSPALNPGGPDQAKVAEALKELQAHIEGSNNDEFPEQPGQPG